MTKKTISSFILGASIILGSAWAQAGYYKCVDTDLRSKNYRPGEGFSLEIGGPIIPKTIKFLTAGDHRANLSVVVNGVYQGAYDYKYHWENEWAVFDVENPRSDSGFQFTFGKEDPTIKRVIIMCDAEKEVVYQVKWKTKYVQVAKAQMADEVSTVKWAMKELEQYFKTNQAYNEFFYMAWLQLNRARYKAEAKRGYNSDPSEIVGGSVNIFLDNYACDFAVGIYSDLEWQYPQIRNTVEKMAISIQRLAALRDHEPVACGASTQAWARKYGIR